MPDAALTAHTSKSEDTWKHPRTICFSVLLEDLAKRAADFAQSTLQLALLARLDIAGGDDVAIATVNSERMSVSITVAGTNIKIATRATERVDIPTPAKQASLNPPWSHAKPVMSEAATEATRS